MKIGTWEEQIICVECPECGVPKVFTSFGFAVIEKVIEVLEIFVGGQVLG